MVGETTKRWRAKIVAEVFLMGVGSRTFQTFLCDGCGREVIAEKGASVEGYYIEVLRVLRDTQVGSENVYACSDVCVERAVRDAVKRESLPEPERITATQELWLRGRVFNYHPDLPIYDAADETRVLGTAQELAEYKPLPPSPKPRTENLES